MRYILDHSQCALDANYVNHSIQKVRTKRNDDIASTSNVYALQSTINDHRTIIDDHHNIINYLMNNTVNITHLNNYYAEQHKNSTPIWSSWRDISLLLLIFICFCIIIYHLVIRLHPVDMLTSILLRRYQNNQQQ